MRAMTAEDIGLPAPINMERRLAEAGVFAGHAGLRGLLNATEFWEQQMYGTRLYFGPGGLDYLHRDVLRAAVRLLDSLPHHQEYGQ